MISVRGKLEILQDMKQLSLLERADSEKTRGIERAEVGASAEWLDTAYKALEELARKNGELTSDDVWFLLEQRQVVMPREHRAMGPVMRRAAQAGIIRPSSKFRLSNRPVNHRRPQRVWMAR